MKKIIFLLLISIHSCLLLAQDFLSNTAEPEQLLKNENQFKAYTEAVDQHCGIFGKQPGKGLAMSHDILLDIVQTENRGMHVFRKNAVLQQAGLYSLVAFAIPFMVLFFIRRK